MNNIPIFQAGANLNYLGKIKLTIKNKTIASLTYELIDLTNYANSDLELKDIIDTYNKNANLDEVIGYANAYHSKSEVGYFYTEALRIEMNVDFTIQNTGGVRSTLNEGNILKREIYTIDPFNNGSVTYTMTAGEIKNFLRNSGAGFYYSGLLIEQNGNYITLTNLNNEPINDSINLTIGLNDYIPAVYDTFWL